MENGMRRPKFRIQLSGNPILGDGQIRQPNLPHLLPWRVYSTHDANQDNYLEECLKIRMFLPNSRRWLPITSLHNTGVKP